MSEPKFRHEFKHSITPLDYHAIRQRLRQVASPDRHVDPEGRYHVRSLYFDNLEDKALREKLYGLSRREKFRIRLYNGSRAHIRLEKKSKERGLCRKESVTLTEEETAKILALDLHWMSHSTHPLLLELYSKMKAQGLRPKTIVDYSREAYTYPFGNVRITFDFDVRTGLYSRQLFDYDSPTLAVSEGSALLMEVKYDAFLPDLIRDLIQTNTRRTEAFSKYAACRIYG